MAMTIGSITLRDFEVPSVVRFGGTHRTVVHRLADGRRVIDRLGRDETDISFSGVISGVDATPRVRALDLLRSAGGSVSLRWDSFQFDVILRQFIADFQSAQWIPYQLSCAVLDQPGAGLVGDLSTDISQIQSDLEELIRLDPVWEARLGAQVRSVTGVSAEQTDPRRAQNLVALLRDLSLQAGHDLQTIEGTATLADEAAGSNGVVAQRGSLAGSMARAALTLAYLNRIESALTAR